MQSLMDSQIIDLEVLMDAVEVPTTRPEYEVLTKSHIYPYTHLGKEEEDNPYFWVQKNPLYRRLVCKANKCIRSECPLTHSPSETSREIRRMIVNHPKYKSKLCKAHQRKQCVYSASECIYAHGKGELKFPKQRRPAPASKRRKINTIVASPIPVDICELFPDDDKDDLAPWKWLVAKTRYPTIALQWLRNTEIYRLRQSIPESICIEGAETDDGYCPLHNLDMDEACAVCGEESTIDILVPVEHRLIIENVSCPNAILTVKVCKKCEGCARDRLDSLYMEEEEQIEDGRITSHILEGARDVLINDVQTILKETIPTVKRATSKN